MRHFVALLACAALVGLAGCGEEKKPIVPVEGRLKLSDGKLPPVGTKLLFSPAEGRTGTASATTDAGGAFKLTHVSGSDGAEIGKYTVQLLPPPSGDKEFYKLIPRDTADGALFAEIKAGMGPLELTVPKGK